MAENVKCVPLPEVSNYEKSFNKCFDDILNQLDHQQKIHLNQLNQLDHEHKTDPPKNIILLEIKLKWLNLLQSKRYVLLNDLKTIFRRENIFKPSHYKTILLRDLPVVIHIPKFNMFKEVTFDSIVVLKSYPDNQQHVQFYNMISLFHDIMTEKTSELDENRLQTAQVLHNLYQKMMFYGQHFVCTELRQIVYELFSIMYCKKVLYIRTPNEKD
eukprot:191426_1